MYRSSSLGLPGWSRNCSLLEGYPVGITLRKTHFPLTGKKMWILKLNKNSYLMLPQIGSMVCFQLFRRCEVGCRHCPAKKKKKRGRKGVTDTALHDVKWTRSLLFDFDNLTTAKSRIRLTETCRFLLQTHRAAAGGVASWACEEVVFQLSELYGTHMRGLWNITSERRTHLMGRKNAPDCRNQEKMLGFLGQQEACVLFASRLGSELFLFFPSDSVLQK